MNRTMKIVLHQKYQPSVDRLDDIESRRVSDAIEKFTQAPDRSGLNLEQLKGRARKKRLWTLRASRDLRVLLVREGPTWVLLRAGHHDSIDRLANQTEFRVPLLGIPSLTATKPSVKDLDGSPLTSKRPVTVSATDSERSILEHWSTGELGKAGFNKDQIRRLRDATQDTLLAVWPDIPDETFDQVWEMAEQSPDEWLQRRLIPDDESRHERFRKAIVERGALGGLSSLLGPEEFQRLMSAPIEDWMIFLHPDQRTLVDRRFSGPARVRGSAGTGKTVVALHRAAALAKRFASQTVQPGRQQRPILFTTFIKSLPPVFENLYKKLPTAVDEAVEFINIDKLAFRICCESGQQPKLDKKAADTSFFKAYTAVVQSGTPLDRHGLTPPYLMEEVQAVLKGRGVDSLEEYLKMERTGRRTPFTAAMREQAWRLRVEWDTYLDERGVTDFPDVIRRARDLARQRPKPTYCAAIVDESQDITLVGLQFIRALVNGTDEQDRSDALFIVGDGAQKIYPGGFTLAQAGLDVRGNSAVLRVNYRNTREIIDAAMACTGSEPVVDLGEEYTRGDAAADAVRNSNLKPCLVRAAKFSNRVNFVVNKIQEFHESQGLRYGDIGIFAATGLRVDQVLEKFRHTPLSNRFQNLKDFKGQPNDFIKIGTFHRAKGLEFKVVFLFEISEKYFPAPRKDTETDDEYGERRALEVSTLFVAMTRARDHLFLISNDKPSEVLREARDWFDEVEA